MVARIIGVEAPEGTLPYVSMIAVAPRAPFATPGRFFIHPSFDYLLIAGGLSLLFGVGIWAADLHRALGPWLATLIIVANGAHFAASTVRLYTRPGVTKALPFLALGLPVIAVLVASAAIMLPEPLGLYLFSVYVVWSPYHYSAQAYGLAVMYGYRAGVALSDGAKRVVWIACLFPFVWTLLQPQGGVADVLRWWKLSSTGPVEVARSSASSLLVVITLVAPVLLMLFLRQRHAVSLPLISVVTIASNAVWWTLFNFFDAFLWAAVFHGVQYLAIVTIFHVKDRLRDPANTRGMSWHAGSFYVVCLVLGYILFNVWPFAYSWAGYNLQKAALLTTAAINIHHFVVDAYIWRLRKDPNYRNVVEEPAARGGAVVRIGA
jgi:hypothetical protein